MSSGRDQGTAGLIIVLACTTLTGFGFLIPVAASVSGVHAQADTAADLSALAVAGALLSDANPCDAGRRIATANGAQLHRCRLDGLSAYVRVSVPLSGPLARLSAQAAVSAEATAEIPEDPFAQPAPP